MTVLGLDIGGANLKIASDEGTAVEVPFPLWRSPESLAPHLRDLLSRLPRPDRIGVVMTGELADCFASKAEGVAAIVDAVEQAAAGIPTRYWNTWADFVSSEAAAGQPLQIAAANWHALATFCGRVAPEGAALLLDIGSTTSDLIPIIAGEVATVGLTDTERLMAGELVYTGVRRTPLCAFGPTIEANGETFPLAAEFFATMQDVYLVTGDLAEEPADCGTADGRPATIPHARQRIARMLCADAGELPGDMIQSLAGAFARRQFQRLGTALEALLERTGPVEHVVLSGSGTFLGRKIVSSLPALADAGVVSLENAFSRPIATAACAFAVAKLLAERE